MDYFNVTKADDIRMVHNGSSCGLKKCVWDPSFWLHTAKTASRSLSYNYVTMDKVIGEMFLNFRLTSEYLNISGIDLSHFKAKLGYVDETRRKKQVCSNV